MLDEELSRLPDHYRGVVVLCDLEGMTRKEAARQLGIPEGSVASRLARARAMLAKRLTRRGVVFSGGSVAAVLSAGSASASAPPALVASTIKAASLLAAGQAAGVVSAKVAALTEGVVKAMFVTKIKSVLAVVLVVGLALGGIGAGVGLSTHSAAVAQQPGAKVDDGKKNDDKAAKDGTEKKPDEKENPKTGGKAGKEERKVLTPEEAIKQMPKENVTVEFKVASVEVDFTHLYSGYPGSIYIHLKDGGKFRASLINNQFARWDADQIKKLGIKTNEDFKGKMLRVTGRVEHFGDTFVMWVRDGKNIEVVEEKPSEKQLMPKEEPAPKNAGTEQKVLTPEEALKLRSKEKVTVQFKVAGVDDGANQAHLSRAFISAPVFSSTVTLVPPCWLHPSNKRFIDLVSTR